jgi:zinc protease
MTIVATPARAAPTTVERVVSPGGVEAWLVEEHAVPIVAMEFAFLGGASQDPSDKAGVAHLTSGVLDEGAGPLDSDAFQTRLADRAIELNFDADRDTLRGSLKTLVKHADEAFELTRLAVTEARFDASAVERVRAQILAGLRHEAQNPESLSARAFYANAFAGHPYGHPVRGTIDSIAAVGRGDLVRYRDGKLARSNLRVAVVGAIDAAALGRALDRIFGALPAAPQLAPVASTKAGGLGKRVVIDVDVPQSVVRFGCSGIPRLDADYIPGYVINHILGGGVFTARLFREVREKRGLAYGVSTSLVPMRHAALLAGGTATKNERVAESISVIKDEIRKLAGEGPETEELRLAKQYLIGSYALHFDTSTKIASQLLQISIEGLGIDYVDRRNGLVDAVTLEDARRVAKRLLGDGELLIVVAGQPVGLD